MGAAERGSLYLISKYIIELWIDVSRALGEVFDFLVADRIDG